MCARAILVVFMLFATSCDRGDGPTAAPQTTAPAPAPTTAPSSEQPAAERKFAEDLVADNRQMVPPGDLGQSMNLIE